MSAGHTPGPWHDLDIGEIVPSDDDGFPHETVRICFMATAGSDPTAAERIEANARLIAAAPELLEVAQQALFWLEGAARQKAVEAIARATGAA